MQEEYVSSGVIMWSAVLSFCLRQRRAAILLLILYNPTFLLSFLFSLLIEEA